MCLGAIYWARPEKIVFAGTREDAAKLDLMISLFTMRFPARLKVERFL